MAVGLGRRAFGESQDHQPTEMVEEHAAVEEFSRLPIAEPTPGRREMMTTLLRDGARRMLAEIVAWIVD